MKKKSKNVHQQMLKAGNARKRAVKTTVLAAGLMTHVLAGNAIDYKADDVYKGDSISYFQHFFGMEKASADPDEGDEGSSEPESGGSEPESSGGEPESGGSEPESGGSEPESGGSEPESGGSEPESGGSEPESGGSEPESGGSEPESGGGEPESSGGEPESGGGEPESGGSEPPQTGGSRPESSSSSSQTTNSTTVSNSIIDSSASTGSAANSLNQWIHGKLENGSVSVSVDSSVVRKLSALDHLDDLSVTILPNASHIQMTLPKEVLSFLRSQEKVSSFTLYSNQSKMALALNKLNIQRASSLLHVPAEQLDLQINIDVLSNDELSDLKQSLPAGLKLLEQPVRFNIQWVASDQTLKLDQEELKNVTRIIHLGTTDLDPQTATVLGFNEETRTYTYVPAYFVQNKGQWEVRIRDMQYSTYVIASNEQIDTSDNGSSINSIEYMQSKQLLALNQFKTGEPVTRGEVAQLLVSALGANGIAAKDASFRDVTEEQSYAATAAHFGLVKGYADGTFRADRQVTREELASMIHRTIQFAGGDSVANTSAAISYQDQDSISPWATAQVQALTSLGLLQDTFGTSFEPKKAATTDEALMILVRTLRSIEYVN
ncbi:S-layer homology domain-containing protein [Paenibacillus sp. NPDC057886]|uniref:S-layer homology domain-containing protein n=1 Tax=Paenibacillus sp. NPDC057886 TaxID=3346270 RepID=UPI00367BD2AF